MVPGLPGGAPPIPLPAPAPASPMVCCLISILLEICQSSRWGVGEEVGEEGWKNRFPPLGLGWRGGCACHPRSPPSPASTARLAQEFHSQGRNQTSGITVN